MVITAYSTTLPEYRRCHQAHWKGEITWSGRPGAEQLCAYDINPTDLNDQIFLWNVWTQTNTLPKTN